MANLIFIFLWLLSFNLNLPVEQINYRNELEKYNITFTGKWTDIDLYYVYSGIIITGNKLLEYTDIRGSPLEAFVYTYKINNRNPFVFEHYNTGKIGGITYSSKKIGFSGFYRNYHPLYEDIKLSSINLVIHEIGHAFEYLVYEESKNIKLIPYNVLLDVRRNGYFPNRDGTNNYFGYCGLRWDYQQSPSTHPREEFADMFIGWVCNCWEDCDDGELRNEFMDSNMGIWLKLVVREHFYNKDYRFGSRYFVY